MSAGVVVQRRDDAVHQTAQQAASLQPAHAARLEPLLHMVLHAGEIAAEGAQGGVTGQRQTGGRRIAQRGHKESDGLVGLVGQGKRVGHYADVSLGIAGGTAASALRR